MENPRRFLVLFVVFSALSALGVAAINLAVDPYNIYRAVTGSFNRHKPQERFFERLIRPHDISRIRPDVILLGTSRTQVGLDPASPAFSGIAERVVNAAVSDGTPYESLRFLQHAGSVGHVKMAIMGLDFLAFDDRPPAHAQFSEWRIAATPEGRPNPFFRVADWVPTLLSMDALAGTRHTLRRQEEPSYFYEGGRRRPETMEARIVQEGGMRGAMRFSEADYLQDYACYHFEPARSRALEDFKKILTFSRERDIHLIVFFSPSHARSQLAIRAAGLWESYESWKHQITDLVSKEGRGTADLWDFTGADPNTTAEPIASSPSGRMRFYWESSHYRKELGDLALHRMLGTAEGEQLPGFGVRLTPDTLEHQLDRMAREVDEYASAHPEDMVEVDELAKVNIPAARAAKGCRAPAPMLAGETPW